MGNKGAPLGDDDIAASITLTGQYIIKAARTFARDYITKVIGRSDFEDIAVAGDTDSIYMTVTPILKHKNLELCKDGVVDPEVLKIVANLNDFLNEKIDDCVRTDLNSLDPRIVFKRESIIDRGLFLQKKRYVAHVVDSDGFPCDKWKYTGVEVVRTTMPKAIKPYVKKIIETMLVTENRAATNAVINEAYEVFKKLTPEEIAYTSGMKDYNKHADFTTDFKTPKGCPVHVKSAIFHNTILDRLEIAQAYEKLQSGDKVKWMYVQTPNKYGIESIAFKYYYPKEFADVFVPDYELMFEKIVFSVVERFFAAVKWPAHKPTEQMKVDLFDLFR